VSPGSITSSNPRISLDEALAIAERAFESKRNGISSLEYFINDKDDAVLTHVVQVENGR
jgi:hypothetical protein